MLTKAHQILRPLSYSVLVGTIAVLAGCAQTPSTESSGRGTTLSNAQEQARGGRGHAASQWAVGFGDKEGGKANSEAAPAATGVVELAQAQTFIGTIACGPTAISCAPTRLTITMQPDGIWHLRASDTTQDQSPTVARGCWHQIGSAPNRIVLQTQKDTVLTDLTFINPNQVRVNVFNYVSPHLETHLSRQPELQEISAQEYQTGPSLNCRP